MWPRTRAVTAAFALTLAACAAANAPSDGDPAPACPANLPDSSGCPDSAPSYATEIRPLVDLRCIGCHYEGNRNSKQVLETYEQLRASVSLIEKEVYHCEMPPSGEPPLSESERRTLLEWLVCGAPNN
jgi:hypothetical protein